MTMPSLVPELDVHDLVRSLDFYCRVVGFRVWFDRPEERFAYLVLDRVHLMLEEAAGPVPHRPARTSLRPRREFHDQGR